MTLRHAGMGLIKGWTSRSHGSKVSGHVERSRHFIDIQQMVRSDLRRKFVMIDHEIVETCYTVPHGMTHGAKVKGHRSTCRGRAYCGGLQSMRLLQGTWVCDTRHLDWHNWQTEPRMHGKLVRLCTRTVTVIAWAAARPRFKSWFGHMS